MKSLFISPITKFNQNINIPSDKSITHRAFMLAPFCKGSVTVHNPLLSLDTISTLNCMEKLGAIYEVMGNDIVFNGINLNDNVYLNCENSGTTARLLAGLVAGLNINATLYGDSSLSKRPMERVINPLQLMGANIKRNESLFDINPSKLYGKTININIASAQIKSCILLAGLNAQGKTTVIEKEKTRSHTENMLQFLGADISINQDNIEITNSNLTAKDLFIPKDISSFAYFVALALSVKNTCLKIDNVALDSLRSGFINLLISSGASINVRNIKTICNETVGEIEVKNSLLSPLNASPCLVPSMIDEIPILSVCACKIKGTSCFSGVSELIYKESNRIDSIVNLVNNLGSNAYYRNENLYIEGTGKILGTTVKSFSDHRIAMAAVVGGLLSDTGLTVDDVSCIDISYPNFLKDMGVI